jgi:hypothetical protein
MLVRPEILNSVRFSAESDVKMPAAGKTAITGLCFNLGVLDGALARQKRCISIAQAVLEEFDGPTRVFLSERSF